MEMGAMRRENLIIAKACDWAIPTSRIGFQTGHSPVSQPSITPFTPSSFRPRVALQGFPKQQKQKTGNQFKSKDLVVVSAKFSKVTTSSQVRPLNTKFPVYVAAKLELTSFHFSLTILTQK